MMTSLTSSPSVSLILISSSSTVVMSCNGQCQCSVLRTASKPLEMRAEFCRVRVLWSDRQCRPEHWVASLYLVTDIIIRWVRQTCYKTDWLTDLLLKLLSKLNVQCCAELVLFSGVKKCKTSFVKFPLKFLLLTATVPSPTLGYAVGKLLEVFFVLECGHYHLLQPRAYVIWQGKWRRV